MARKRVFRILLKTVFWAVIGSILLVTVLKWVPVRYTPLMLKRSIQQKEVRPRQEWVSLEHVAPELIQAVIAGEDNRFCEHRGFDWKEIRKMWTEHKERGRKLRGCSTISQQVAKNVFTFGSRTWIRKGAETWWTFLIERIWGKRRIMEVYLNVAETGPGLFGMEAAAEHYYNRKAQEIDKKQACAITACLPAPLDRNPEKPTPALRRRQSQISALIPKLSYPDWAL